MDDHDDKTARDAVMPDPLIETLMQLPEIAVNAKVCLTEIDNDLAQRLSPLVSVLESKLPRVDPENSSDTPATLFNVAIWPLASDSGTLASEEFDRCTKHLEPDGAVVFLYRGAGADAEQGMLDIIALVSASGFHVSLHRGGEKEDRFSVIVVRPLSSNRQASDARPLQLDCFLEGEQQLDIEPAPLGREWMDATGEQFAYRCLPLNIANAYGWELLSPSGVTAIWNGGPRVEDITVAHDDEDAPQFAMSHFANGVLTFSVRGLFRTEPGYDLWVGGPFNRPKKHAYALTGIIETDWLEFTFTMNWLMTTPNFPVRFQKDEPFCLIHPVPRGLVERFDPKYRPIDEKPELAEAFRTYRESRNAFNADLKVEGSEARKQKWQRNYFRGPEEGVDIDPPHRTKVRLRRFRQQ